MQRTVAIGSYPVVHRTEFERITEGLSDALGFTRTIGFGMDGTPYERGGSRGVLGEVDFYTRHGGFPSIDISVF